MGNNLIKKTFAIDIGGTFIKYGMIEEDMHISWHAQVPTEECVDKDSFFDYLCGHLPSMEGVHYIGVSAPGLIDNTFNVRSYAAPKTRALLGANIRMEIERRTKIKTAAINDGKAAGLCELKLGNARGTNLSAFLIIGTGGGGCICTKEDVFGGADNFAGEFHFMAYPNEETGKTLKTGRQIGTIGLIKRYNQRCSDAMQVTLGKEIIKRYHAGEELASEIVLDWIHRIALQCLTINVSINPEILCIGGGISEEDWFLESVKKEYNIICESHFDGVNFLSTRIDRCKFLNNANLLGAALKVNMFYENEI